MKRTLRSFFGDKRGNVLVMAGAAVPVMIGGAGLATDTMQWALIKRQLQREADSAALSGAYALTQDKSARTSAEGDIARTAEVTLSANPVIETPPTAGAGIGNASAVRVALQASRVLPFSSLFLTNATQFNAEATAAVVDNGNYCVIALEPTSTTGIIMSGSSTVDMGCGMATNSRSGSAVDTGGSSTVNATPIAAVGGLQWSNNYASGTQLKPYQVAQKDPFASLPNPDISAMSCSNLSVGVKDNQKLSPDADGTKCIKNVDIKGTLRLDPGVYYVDGGDFSVGSQAKITGDGVTIILTSKNASTNPSSIATVTMNAGADISLKAPKSGTYKGVIFYQDRRALDTGDNKINGNSSAFYQGAFYFPKQQLTFNGTSGMSTDCMQLVGRRVKFVGNSSISNTCPVDEGAGSFKGTGVRLIG